MRREAVWRLAFLTVAVLVAGCIGSADPSGDTAPVVAGDGNETHVSLPANASFAYHCPPGDTLQVTEAVCAGLVDDPLHALGEPRAAVHPDDPDTIAIGVSDGKATPSGEPTSAGVEPRGLAVYVTEDGGETWVRQEVPVGDVPGTRAVRSGADPSVVIGADGTLHVAGLLLEPSPATGSPQETDVRVMHTRSTDFGETWATPTLVAADGDNDREWLSAGPNGTLQLGWRNQANGTAGVAFSHDAGETWTREGRAGLISPCDTVSPIEATEIGKLAACQVGDDLTIHRLEPAEGEAERIADVPDGCPSNSPFVANPVGEVLAVACYGGQVIASPDGGETWPHRIDVIERSSLNEDWPSSLFGTFVYAMGTGSQNYLHVLFTQLPEGAGNVAVDRGHRPVGHVALHPTDLSIVHETELKPPEPTAPRSPPPTVGQADDYYDVVATEHGTLLVWTTNEWETAYAWASPVDAEPSPTR